MGHVVQRHIDIPLLFEKPSRESAEVCGRLRLYITQLGLALNLDDDERGIRGGQTVDTGGQSCGDRIDTVAKLYSSAYGRLDDRRPW